MLPQTIHEDRLQPTTKSARLPTMLELAKILRYRQQNFLNEVVGVAVLDVVSPQPRPNQRRVKIR
jgi:hypothetical protein